jgi:hypothetical protein
MRNAASLGPAEQARATGLWRSRFAAACQINGQRLEAELLIHIADLEAVSLVESGFQHLDAFET